MESSIEVADKINPVISEGLIMLFQGIREFKRIVFIYSLLF